MNVVFEQELAKDPRWIGEWDARFLLNDYDRDVVSFLEHYSFKVKFAHVVGGGFILFNLSEVLAFPSRSPGLYFKKKRHDD